jgi:hypothetical protein
MFLPGYGPIAIADWSITVQCHWSNMGFSVYCCSRWNRRIEYIETTAYMESKEEPANHLKWWRMAVAIIISMRSLNKLLPVSDANAVGRKSQCASILQPIQSVLNWLITTSTIKIYPSFLKYTVDQLSHLRSIFNFYMTPNTQFKLEIIHKRLYLRTLFCYTTVRIKHTWFYTKK